MDISLTIYVIDLRFSVYNLKVPFIFILWQKTGYFLSFLCKTIFYIS